MTHPLLEQAKLLGLAASAWLPSSLASFSFPEPVRSLLLLGSSGEDFFRLFQQSEPKESTDPLDRYTQKIVSSLVEQYAPEALGVYYPFEAPFLPFRQMAERAGLGRLSPLGVLVSPEYGPWFALRAAVAFSFEVKEPIAAPDLCLSCEAPCIAACPGGAVLREGLGVERCGSSRLENLCRERCAAREACPVGVHWRYQPEAIRFHHKAATLFFRK